MLKLAVIGKDVSKSLSPEMHGFILQKLHTGHIYDAISVAAEDFSARAEELLGAYDGLNVTIPFKQEILPFLKRIEGDAEDFGAVNTVRCKERAGYNTDGSGFMLMLENESIQIAGKSVLVLGAGGAGRSCIKKLTAAGAAVSVYERDGERLRKVLSEFGGFTPLADVPAADFDVVINCTGVGMHQTVGQLPTVKSGEREVSCSFLLHGEAAVDLIYEPAESAFLKEAKRRGMRTVNGLGMLFYQAYWADCIFLQREASADEAKRFYREYREEQR